jgi:copper(I)-binding protein
LNELRSRSEMWAPRYVAGGVVAVLLVAACSSGTGTISVEDAWGRTAPSSAFNAAFYMTITGGETDDVLVSADADVCGAVELHETVMNDGVMQMQHLPAGIPIQAGAVVALEPGGMHIMCLDKNADLVSGESVSVTLVFGTASSQVVEFEIRDQ